MHVFRNGIISARDYYAELGLETLPIMADTKHCPVKNWPNVSTNEAWLYAPSDSNIGIRCGGAKHFAVIDCDDKKQPGTFNNVINYLAGHGFDKSTLPIVQTASGIGRHIYFTLSEYMPGNYSNLSTQFGSGEFRYGKGAYVVVPPSIIEGYGEYTWLRGDLSCLPVVEYSCIAGILVNPKTVDAEEETRKYTRELKFTRTQKDMLNGNGIDKYTSRSEFECALVNSLINTGWDFGGIMSLFNKFPCGGKYFETNFVNPSNAYHYLKLTYDNASQYTASNVSEGRQLALNAEAWASSNTWSGRTGSYDRDVFLAHVNIAKKSGKIQFHASCREVAELANIPRTTAARSTQRLVKSGYLSLVNPGIGNCASIYRLNKTGTLPHPQNVRKCPIINCEHDVFSRNGLGKSSKLIWEVLTNSSKEFNEIVQQTGRHQLTIRKWLRIMNGLYDGISSRPMVYEFEGKWYRNQDISLDRISDLLNVKGVMEKRKKRHQEERANHNKAFMRNERI